MLTRDQIYKWATDFNLHFSNRTHLLDAVSALEAIVAQEKEKNKCISELETSLQTMRASFHVNMLRAFPALSHAEIESAIDAALKGEK